MIMVMACVACVRIKNPLGCCVGLVHHEFQITRVHVLSEHTSSVGGPVIFCDSVVLELAIAFVDEAINEESS